MPLCFTTMEERKEEEEEGASKAHKAVIQIGWHDSTGQPIFDGLPTCIAGAVGGAVLKLFPVCGTLFFDEF